MYSGSGRRRPQQPTPTPTLTVNIILTTASSFCRAINQSIIQSKNTSGDFAAYTYTTMFHTESPPFSRRPKQSDPPGPRRSAVISAHHRLRRLESVSQLVSTRNLSLDGDATAPVSYTGQEPSIEIFPGFCARLRGADETRKCIQDGNYLPVSCLTCTMDICCILDADYVICPCCQGITPLSDEPTGLGGVGLGVSGDDVCQKFQEKFETVQQEAQQETPSSATSISTQELPTKWAQVSLADIFPKHVADQLQRGIKPEAEEKEEVTM